MRHPTRSCGLARGDHHHHHYCRHHQRKESLRSADLRKGRRRQAAGGSLHKKATNGTTVGGSLSRCRAQAAAGADPPRLRYGRGAFEEAEGETSSPDVVVIGSGIGGLCCAALLARYGKSVTVLESHDVPGGAAHAWVRDGYHFESGPSLYSGMTAKNSPNPLGQVFQALDIELPW